MPVLDDARHEEFCLLIVTGHNATRAYLKAVTDQAKPCKVTSAMVEGCKMMAQTKIRQRIAEMREEFRDVAEEKFGVTKESIIRGHLEILETPLSEVDDSHPLCQELQRTRVVVGKGEEAMPWEIEKVKLPSKSDSMKELARLGGYYEPDKLEVSAPLNWDGIEKLALTSKVFGDQVIALAERVKAARFG